MKQSVRIMIKKMNLDPNDPNFKGTPERVEKMWKTFTKPEELKLTDFPYTLRGGMVLMRNHEAYGFCPHHLLPVKYTFTFGYLPRHKKVVGASKPLRAFNIALSKLPLQEDIAPMVIESLLPLDPMGMGVIIKGEHFCMRMRGVQSPCSDMVTDCMYGLFLHSHEVRQEFLKLGGEI